MKTKYALKALTYLARAEEGRPVLIAEIAEREAIPRKFLEVILRDLRHGGLLDSRKGRGGGYALRHSPANISVASVLEALDGSLAPVPCLSRTQYRRCDGCLEESTCAVRLVMADLYAATIGVLEAITLADIVNRVDRASEIRLRLSTPLTPATPSR